MSDASFGRLSRLAPGAWMAAAVFFTMAVAAFNGFPLVYFDTGAYLRSAAEGIVPADRPVFYGLFLKLCHMVGGSLWAAVLAQATIVVACIRALVPALPVARFVSIIVGLSLFSSLPWLVGQLMPDVLTATLVLSFATLAEGGLSGARRVLMSAVFVLSTLVHHSHVVIVAIGLAVLGVHVVLQARGRLRAWAQVAALWASCLAITPLTNGLLTGEFSYSTGGHHFLMARMLQWGVMQRYLEDACPQVGSPFCQYRDVLSSEVGRNYLWDPRSPLEALGGWRARRNETLTAIRGAAAAFPAMTVAHAGADALKQLTRVRTGEGSYPYDASMNVVGQLRTHFPAEFSAFRDSKQQAGRLLTVSRALEWLHLGALMSALAILLGSARTRTFRYLAVLGLILVNIVVCGVLSAPDDRYGSRVAWIPVFLALASLGTKRHADSAGEGGAVSRPPGPTSPA